MDDLRLFLSPSSTEPMYSITNASLEVSEMTNLEVTDELAEQIESFSHRTGESKDHLVREAILTYLEDREDAIIAAERLKIPEKRISLEEIGRKYGLVD